MNSKSAEAFARVIDEAHDKAKQARSQAIDDCIAAINSEYVAGGLLQGQRGLTVGLVVRLEALTGST